MSEPGAFIREGTKMALEERRQNYSEEQVKQKSSELISLTDKIVLVICYSRDVDRFRNFYEAAIKNGRQIDQYG
jgi:mRNA degradation ribonuclease J1/J2